MSDPYLVLTARLITDTILLSYLQARKARVDYGKPKGAYYL